MSGFTKLFGSIITSSVWSEDDKTRIMWITMLATADALGHVDGSMPGMADIARMSIPQAEKAIQKLCGPDPYSRTPDKQGARLTVADGGWNIVNYGKYRQRRDPEKRREQNRKAQEAYRSKQKVSQSKPPSAQAEAEADKEKEVSFLDFWKLFKELSPSTIGSKKNAKAKWQVAIKKTEPERIIVGLIEFSRQHKRKIEQDKFTPAWKHCERWLKSEEWKLEPEPDTSTPFDHEAAEQRQKMLAGIS